MEEKKTQTTIIIKTDYYELITAIIHSDYTSLLNQLRDVILSEEYLSDNVIKIEVTAKKYE